MSCFGDGDGFGDGGGDFVGVFGEGENFVGVRLELLEVVVAVEADAHVVEVVGFAHAPDIDAVFVSP